MSAWEGSRAQEAQEDRVKIAKPSETPESAAIKLLEAAGYRIAKIQGQHQIQIVRMRDNSSSNWKYKINKYEKAYFPDGEEECQAVCLDVNKLEWKKQTKAFFPKSEPTMDNRDGKAEA